jgi:hypothetical protein
MQALARGNDAGRQVSRELTGAGFGREVTLTFVVVDLRIGEGVQTASGFGFTGGPERAQGVAGRVEACNA